MMERASWRNCVLRGTLALAVETHSALDAITPHPNAKTRAIRATNPRIPAQ
jgi:hypothetical protein